MLLVYKRNGDGSLLGSEDGSEDGSLLGSDEVSSRRVASAAESNITIAVGVLISGTLYSASLKVEIWRKSSSMHVSVFMIHLSYLISSRRQMHDKQTHIPWWV